MADIADMADMAPADMAPADTAAPSVAPVKQRCLVCNKKVGMIGFKCKCLGLFCGTHRNEYMHDCSFNFTLDKMEVLTKHLVAVGSDKGLHS